MADDAASRLPSVGLTLAASVIVRIAFSAVLGYGVDEAYAVSVSRPLSLSYFDHPPLHFWIAGAMTWLTGSTHPVLVRLPFIAAFTGTMYLIGALTRRAFGESAARGAVLGLAASGVLGVTSGTWVLPDGPLLLGTTVGVYLLAPVLAAPPADGSIRTDAWCRWLLAGAAFGLASLSKLHALLIIGGVAAFVLADRDARQQLRTPWPWLSLLVILALFLPVVVWNVEHDWASFRFQGARARASTWSLAPFAAMAGGQLVWLLPWIGVPLLIALLRAPASTESARRWRRYLQYVAAGPILVFTLIPLGGARGLPHWTAPGWLFAFPLLGTWATTVSARDRGTARVRRHWLISAAFTTLALLFAIMVHAGTALSDRWLDADQRDRDPSRDAVPWAPAVAKADVYFARSWIQGGQLGVALGPSARIVCLCDDPHHFAQRRPGESLRAGETGLLLERLRRQNGRDARRTTALGGDSLRIIVRDTVHVGRGVSIIRYNVRRIPRSTDTS